MGRCCHPPHLLVLVYFYFFAGAGAGAGAAAGFSSFFGASFFTSAFFSAGAFFTELAIFLPSFSVYLTTILSPAANLAIFFATLKVTSPLSSFAMNVFAFASALTNSPLNSSTFGASFFASTFAASSVLLSQPLLRFLDLLFLCKYGCHESDADKYCQCDHQNLFHT